MSFVLKDQHVPPTQKSDGLYPLDEKALKKKIAAEQAAQENQTKRNH